jgi:hypothetical protein
MILKFYKVFLIKQKDSSSGSLVPGGQNFPDMNMSGIQDMLSKFGDIMQKMNDPNLSEEEAEKILSSASSDIQGMNQKFQKNFEDTFSKIMDNDAFPSELKNMLSGVKNNLDSTMKNLDLDDENLDPNELTKKSEDLMGSLQNLIKKTMDITKNNLSDDENNLIEQSNSFNQISNSNDLLKKFNNLESRLETAVKNNDILKSEIKILRDQLGIHEKILKHLSERK